VRADLGKTGSGGNPHGFAMLVGMLLVMAFSSVTLLVLSVVEGRLQRPGLALGLMVAWTALAACLSRPLLDLASRAVTGRRENLLLVARGR